MQEKIQEDLEDSGFLNSMKAMIRDQIYASIKTQQKEPIFTLKSLPEELDSEVGHIACALVVDFLEQFGMNHTLKLLYPECQISNQSEVIRDLQEKLNLKSTHNRPMLFEIVDQLFVDEDEESQNQDSHISEDIESMQSTNRKEDPLVESGGTSQGYDQSVNSLDINEFDYVEDVKKSR